MAKGQFKARRSFRKTSRFRKTRFTRALVARPSMVSMIPRQFFTPLPNQMKLSLRLMVDRNASSTITTPYWVINIPIAIPSLLDQSATRMFPAGFLAMMQVYSKAQVCRTHVNLNVISTGTDPGANGDLVTSIITTGSAQFATVPQAFSELLSMPISRRYPMSTIYGGRSSVIDNRLVDVAKFIADPLTRDYSIVANTVDFTNGLTSPSIIEDEPLPEYCVAYSPAVSPTAATEFRLQYVIDYHIEFSSLRHMAVTQASNALAATFSWNVRA